MIRTDCTIFVFLITLVCFTQKCVYAKSPSDNFNPHVILGDNFYYINIYQKTNWFRAVITCASQGYFLASIASEQENENLKTFLLKNGILGGEYWLSANDLATPQQFYWWSVGQPLSYTNWGKYPIDNRNELQACVRTLNNFKWIVDNCQTEHYFICSQPVQPPCGITNECQKRF